MRHYTSDTNNGTLSIVRNTHYRYFTDDTCTGSNPGAQHKMKMILRPENYDRAEVALSGDPLTKTDDDVDNYANVQFEYDCTDYRVAQIIERGSSCGGCGVGSSVGTTIFTWTVVADPSNYDSVKMHVAIDLPEGESGTDLYIDTNRVGDVINWVRVDGSEEWRYHYDYGTELQDTGRLLKAYGPDTVTAYDAGTRVATLDSSVGLVYVYAYSFTYGLLERISTRLGETAGSETPLWYYYYTSTSGDYSITLAAEGPGNSSTSAKNVQYGYTFYDAGGDEIRIKEITIDDPIVPSTQNGSGVRVTFKAWYDDSGLLRWTQDGEGNVNYYGYDDGIAPDNDETGQPDLMVIDVNTATLLTTIDEDWVGAAPYTGNSSALDLETSVEYDSLGRVRKFTEPDGAITYRAHNLDDIREYRKWDATNNKPLLPTRIWLTDKENEWKSTRSSRPTRPSL